MTSPNSSLEILRYMNRRLIALSITEHPLPADIAAECDTARQAILEAIRKLDPKSATDPSDEEKDVVIFHTIIEGHGQHILDNLGGGQDHSLS